MQDDLSSTSLESLESDDPATIFEHALRMLNYQKIWINWHDPYEVAGKTAAAAAAIMTMGPPSRYMGLVLKLFLSVGEKEVRWDYTTLQFEYIKLRDKILVDCTEFIIHAKDNVEIRQGWNTYRATVIMCNIINFIVIYKPCCRLSQMAWLIPAIAADVPALPLICYAAQELADLMNDPLEPFKPDCTPVGNSWLHRLGQLSDSSRRRLQRTSLKNLRYATPPARSWKCALLSRGVFTF